MLYLVTGELSRPEVMTGSHADFAQIIQQAVLPSVTQLLEMQREGKLLAGGVPAGTRKIVFILDLPGAQSHMPVRALFFRLAIFHYYSWEVTPLESFEEWKTFLSP